MSMKPVSGEIATLADELQSAAEELFVGDTRFTNVTVWDDGDFSVVVQHTFMLREQGIGERHREIVRYHQSKDDNPVYRVEYNWTECVDKEEGLYEPQTDVLKEIPIELDSF